MFVFGYLDFNKIEQGLISKYYPKGNQLWNPTNLFYAVLYVLICLNPIRSEDEHRKRARDDFIHEVQDGVNCWKIYEPKGCKNTKSAQQIRNRKYRRIKQRKDNMGAYMLISKYISLFPQQQHIQKGKKLETAFFLRPREAIKSINGSFVGYCNSAVGASMLSRHWKTICGHFNITPCTLYSLRQLIATKATKEGMDPTAVTALTGHSSIIVAKYIQEMKDRNELDREVNDWSNRNFNKAIEYDMNSGFLCFIFYFLF